MRYNLRFCPFTVTRRRKQKMRCAIMKSTALVMFTTLVALPSPNVRAEARFDGSTLKSNLENVRSSFQVPGMAVVALSDGKEIFKEGFGYRNVESREPFTPDTIGLVASTTKSITAGLVGTLVDDGTLDWTTPVREYWPKFKMMDAFASSEMTLEDMLSHRSGLPYHENLLAYGVGRELPDKSKAKEYRLELLNRLQYFEPSYSFRAGWQYQDVIYTSAGGIIEQYTGEHYEDLVQERILDPLGMEHSTFSREAARNSGKLARGYGVVDGDVVAIPFADTRYLAPTAGLYSSAAEMSKWVQLNIDQGKYDDKQVISPESMEWIHGAHAIISNDSKGIGGGLATYGQGWSQHTFRGMAAIGHSG
ncbi:beta-lactamase family protein [Microbulbifer agarilyticus]|uniref:serine hydrolase domain-containing protein n=1 Tax=Microbulbifer agarilyticus TaxID=260552 RepID=UPI001C98A4EA|nr:serine hydrolase domain-containing protein [Microbulbifer agarilyticus]MBY6192155.1 beta-lactamase family protein [Microbulbifer agarilyticus]